MKKIKITRRDFLKTTALSTLAAGSPATFFSCSRPRKLPNILYIMTDDHAYQAISCYGSKINQTPNIDRLASGGVRFVNSFCTNSICAPSRAVLLTGKYSHLNGVTDNRDKFDAAQQTFPKLLQENGYETALFGKWHLKCDPTGFDYWNILPGQGQYYNPDLIEMGEQKQVKGYATNIITDNCLNWLRNRKSVKPFCALLHHKAPHRNWMPDLKHLSMYEDEEIPIPETFFDDYETRCAAAREQEMRIADDTFMTFDLKVKPKEGRLPENEREKIDARIWETAYSRFTEEQREEWDRAYDPRNEKFYKSNLKGKELDKWKYQRYIKDYLRTIASVDDNIGRVLDYLDETGLAKNTIVVYTSDQGFYVGEHGWFDKRFMYEQSLRMPLIIRYPREIKPGVNESDMVQNIDFAPTFLDYAGIGVPDDIQGRSLRSVLQGVTPDDWRQSIYYHYYGYPAWHMVKKHYGVRTHQYKLIHFYDDIDAWELYDLENDPHELNNVYDNPQYSKIVNELKIELKRLREKYKDTNNPEF